MNSCIQNWHDLKLPGWKSITFSICKHLRLHDKIDTEKNNNTERKSPQIQRKGSEQNEETAISRSAAFLVYTVRLRGKRKPKANTTRSRAPEDSQRPSETAQPAASENYILNGSHPTQVARQAQAIKRLQAYSNGRVQIRMAGDNMSVNVDGEEKFSGEPMQGSWEAGKYAKQIHEATKAGADM